MESSRTHYAYCSKHGYKQYILYCPNCRKYFCKDCIAESGEGLFCGQCSSPLIPTSQLPPLRQKSIAVFLALVFGFIGLHAFYTGYIRTGVVHLVLSIIAAFLATIYLWPFAVILLIFVYVVCIAQASEFRKSLDAWGRPLV